MTKTYALLIRSEQVATFSGDFSQASSPVTLDGDSTPFRVADFQHRPLTAARKLHVWMNAEGFGSSATDDEITVTEVAIA